MLRHFFISAVLLYASYKDCKSLEIPDICPVLIAFSSLYFKEFHLWGALLPFLVNFIAAAACAALKKTMPLGFGDIKLLGALGLGLGMERLIPLSASAFIIGGIYALYSLVFSKEGRKEIPFAPCIAAAYILQEAVGLY